MRAFLISSALAVFFVCGGVSSIKETSAAEAEIPRYQLFWVLPDRWERTRYLKRFDFAEISFRDGNFKANIRFKAQTLYPAAEESSPKLTEWAKGKVIPGLLNWYSEGYGAFGGDSPKIATMEIGSGQSVTVYGYKLSINGNSRRAAFVFWEKQRHGSKPTVRFWMFVSNYGTDAPLDESLRTILSGLKIGNDP